jgi:hypothetical protein
LDDFVRQLADGKMLLFLEHVMRVEIWRWDADADKPNLLAATYKQYHGGSSAAPRLPRALQAAGVTASFESLHRYLSQLEDRSTEDAIQAPVVAEVQTSYYSIR